MSSARFLPAVLRLRRFRLLFLGQVFSLLGDGMLPVITSFAVLELGGDAAQVGLVLAAQPAATVLLILVGGVWADRLPRRAVMMVADGLRAAALGTAAILLYSGVAEPWMLAVMGAVIGSCQAFFQPALTGFVPQVVVWERLQEGNAVLGMARSVGFAIGPAVGGVLVATVGTWAAYAAGAGCFAISGGFLLAMGAVPKVAERTEEPSALHELREGYREVRSRTWLWSLILTFTLYLFLADGALFALAPIVSREDYGGPGAFAAVISAIGVGSLLGGVLAYRVRPRRPLMTGTLLLIVTLPMAALFAVQAPLALIIASGLLTGVCWEYYIALWNTTLHREIPHEALSRVSSWDWMGSLAAMPLGLIVVGPLSQAIGIDTVLWLSSLLPIPLFIGVGLSPGVRAIRAPSLEEPAGA